MGFGRRAGTLLLICGFLFFCGLVPAGSSSPVPLTHRVKKGDTLWDLSRHYYGDESLWPKLWEMNPFITNPHLLDEGDILKLKEVPAVEASPAGIRPAPYHSPAAPQAADGLFDVSRLLDEVYAGFFSFDEVRASGIIAARESGHILLEPGDRVFVRMDPGTGAAPGDSFMAYRIAGRFPDPGDGDRSGCAVSFKGKVVLSDRLEGGMFEGTVQDARESISVGDPLLAVPPVEPCISAAAPAVEVEGAVIASRHGRELIGRFDVVYLNRGSRDGLRRGNVLYIQRNAFKDDLRVDTRLPVPPLGSLIVLAVKADSASALVLDAEREIPPGAAVSTVRGRDVEAVVSILPACGQGADPRKYLD